MPHSDRRWSHHGEAADIPDRYNVMPVIDAHSELDLIAVDDAYRRQGLGSRTEDVPALGSVAFSEADTPALSITGLADKPGFDFISQPLRPSASLFAHQ